MGSRRRKAGEHGCETEGKATQDPDASRMRKAWPTRAIFAGARKIDPHRKGDQMPAAPGIDAGEGPSRDDGKLAELGASNR